LDTSAPAAIRNSAKALILRDGSVLLQEQRFAGQSVYLLPGGTQEFGESLGDTVQREVWEETGLRVRVGELLWVREFIPDNHGAPAVDTDERADQRIFVGDHLVESIFRCAPDGDAEPGVGTIPDKAQVGVGWVPLGELPAITMWPEAVKRLLITMDQERTALAPGYLGDCP
jgi:8-oxo-dGTP diphosphatase